jgi:ribosomal-protein-alanine N-acetyltransferase
MSRGMTASLINVRPAHRADIPALIELERATDTAAHWSPAAYADLFPAEGQTPGVRRVVLLAEAEGSVNGFGVARVVAAEWEIENVVVAAAVRRRGVGRALIQAIAAVARREGAERLTLEVRESNGPARRLYESTGFAQCGLRSRYYRGPEEAAILYELRFQ